MKDIQKKKFSYDNGYTVDTSKDINFLTYYKSGNGHSKWRFRQVEFAEKVGENTNPNRKFTIKAHTFVSEAGHFTAKGNSGSPYVAWGSSDTIIGIHSGGHDGKTTGMRITKERYKAICGVITDSGCGGLGDIDTKGSSAYFSGYGDELSKNEFMDEQENFYIENDKQDDYFMENFNDGYYNGGLVGLSIVCLLLFCVCVLVGLCGGALGGFIFG
eukprot:443638_1